MDVGLRLAVVVALVAANGFFVAAEFALVTARKTRIERLAAGGNKAAVAVLRALDDPNRFISACQLGITMASLALGWIGEEAIAGVLEAPLSSVIASDMGGLTAHSISIPLAFALITFLHITLGEQVPKMLALQKGETSAILTVLPTNLLGTIFRPFIKLLEAFTNLVLRMLGMRWHAEMHQSYSTEDVKLIIRSSQAAGLMDQGPDRLVERALDFAQLAAHHVMVPRTEVTAVPADVSLAHLGQLMERRQHSRYPVFEGSPDNIVGILSAKYLASVWAASGGRMPESFSVRRYMSSPLFVPETMRADKLLAEMKLHRSHVAIVVDEYGVTAGLVTLRDLLDRIAGEVRDESELDPPTLVRLPDGSVIVDGLMLLSDAEGELGLRFSEADQDYDTIGGVIFGRLGRRPAIGDRVRLDNHELAVHELDGIRIARVRVVEGTTAAASTETPSQPVKT
jgi:CBS domain containing-hemolysin-like protein